jgi:hypothetical protein
MFQEPVINLKQNVGYNARGDAPGWRATSAEGLARQRE